MNVRILSGLIFFIYCLGYSQQRINFDAEWNPTTQDKMVFYREISRENGLFHIKDFFKNGKLQMEANSLNDKTDEEIFDGKVNWYFENGKIAKTAEFVKGKQTGKEIEYDEKQRIISDLDFDGGKYSGKKYEYKDSPESRWPANSVWEYEHSEVVRYILFDKDIKGIRQESMFDSIHGDISVFYDETGSLIGKNRTGGSDDFTNTEVEYYYDPMKVYRITKYDKHGLQQVVNAFYPSGKVKYEEYNDRRALKKSYDEKGNLIGSLTYYSNSEYNTMPLDGDDVIFDDESLILRSIDHYEDGVLLRSQVFYPNGDRKIVFFNPEKRIVRTEYYDSSSALKGSMIYDKEENPMNGIRFDFYKGRETKFENGRVVYDIKKDENNHLVYQKIFNPLKNMFEVKVYHTDTTLNFSYEFPENEKKFTATVKVYEKDKPIQQVKFLDGVIQNGEIILPYHDYKKVYERKGNLVFEYTYDENNMLTDTVKANANEFSHLTVEEADFLNIGDRQVREVISSEPVPIK